MKRILRIYGLYFAQSLKARLAYKADFFALILSSMLVTIFGLLFIIFLLDGETITELNGWSREEILLIYACSSIATSVFSFLSPNLYRFGERFIIQGQFDRVLLRPVNTLCQVLFEAFNLESIGSLLVGAALFLYSSNELGLNLGIMDVIWLIVACAAGGITVLSVFVLLVSLSFHFEDNLGLAPPVYNMLMFSRYPLPIFNYLTQFILCWIIPFAFVGFFPATHFLGKEEFTFLCYFSPVMALICLIVAWLFWCFGVSKYSSTGS
jgi:ABC-2 type transport system permease protein